MYWTTPENILGRVSYEVEYSYQSHVFTKEIAENVFHLLHLSPNTTVRFAVRAKCCFGVTGPWTFAEKTTIVSYFYIYTHISYCPQ